MILCIYWIAHCTLSNPCVICKGWQSQCGRCRWGRRRRALPLEPVVENEVALDVVINAGTARRLLRSTSAWRTSSTPWRLYLESAPPDARLSRHDLLKTKKKRMNSTITYSIILAIKWTYQDWRERSLLDKRIHARQPAAWTWYWHSPVTVRRAPSPGQIWIIAI